MVIETAKVLTHHRLPGAYRILTLKSLTIAPQVRAGQFVHLRVPRLNEAVLRRPFSVFKADPQTLSILYKSVGKGTQAMEYLHPEDPVNIMGPLGNGFPAIRADAYPVLIAGGYGMAALYLLAQQSPVKGIVFVGGAGAEDILCVDDFHQLGWEVRIATEDGSMGEKGLVTHILNTWLLREAPRGKPRGIFAKPSDLSAEAIRAKAEAKDAIPPCGKPQGFLAKEGERGSRKPEFFACGPIGMLKGVSELAQAGGWVAWLSMDRHMGCGVGACLACVQKVSTRGGSASGGRVHAQPTAAKQQSANEAMWKWARICTEGPVFECRDIIWEKSD